MKHMHVVTAAPGTDWLVATGQRTTSLPASCCAIHAETPWLSRVCGPIGRQGPKNTNCCKVIQEDCCLVSLVSAGLPAPWRTRSHWQHAIPCPRKASHPLQHCRQILRGYDLVVFSEFHTLSPLNFVLHSVLNRGFILALLFKPIRKFALFFSFFHIKPTHWRPLWGRLSLLVIWVTGSLLHSIANISNEV